MEQLFFLSFFFFLITHWIRWVKQHDGFNVSVQAVQPAGSVICWSLNALCRHKLTAWVISGQLSTDPQRLTWRPKCVVQYVPHLCAALCTRAAHKREDAAWKVVPKLCLTYFISRPGPPRLQLPDLIKPGEQREGEEVIKRETETQRRKPAERERERGREEDWTKSILNMKVGGRNQQ